jgi:hypothetical protein
MASTDWALLAYRYLNISAAIGHRVFFPTQWSLTPKFDFQSYTQVNHSQPSAVVGHLLWTWGSGCLLI